MPPATALTATAPEAEAAKPPETLEESTQAARAAGLVAVRNLGDTPAFNRWASGTLSGDSHGGFDSGAARQAKWPFIIAILVLSALLISQLGYYFRTELVRNWHQTGLVFDALDVAVPLSRQGELVSIEASDLQSDNARGLFALNAVLRNRAEYAQAWPSLELTLTDAQDAVVARRIMGAADYLPQGNDLAAFPGSAEIPVRLWIDAKGLGAAGYRLYVFYP